VKQFNTAVRPRAIPPKNVKDWTFDGLERDTDGCFKDSDLANILHNATEARAGAFGARRIPETLRFVEILGIEQARSWGACSVCAVSISNIHFINI
jgi:linoleate 10R-lipoxygenase